MMRVVITLAVILLLFQSFLMALSWNMYGFEWMLYNALAPFAFCAIISFVVSMAAGRLMR